MLELTETDSQSVGNFKIGVNVLQFAAEIMHHTERPSRCDVAVHPQQCTIELKRVRGVAVYVFKCETCLFVAVYVYTLG